MRLIDADAAIESLTEYGNGRAVYISVEEAVRRIEQLPSAQPETNCSEIPNNSDTISRQQSVDTLRKMQTYKLFAGDDMILVDKAQVQTELMMLPSVQPERKTGHWILDRSGAYCCDKCMEPCATYVMMKPRDKFCKMCGSRNEVAE